MDTVLVLIASPASKALTPALVDQLRKLAGGETPVWLAPGEACEIPFIAMSSATVMSEIRALFGKAPIDLSLVPRTNRRKKLLIADMDSTIIAQECIDELGQAAGVGDKVAAITTRAMRGEINLENSLKERLSLLAGLSQSTVAKLVQSLKYTAGGQTLVKTMRAHGAHTSLVSGGFTLFSTKVAEETGFHEHLANELVIEDGKLSGHVREPILGAGAKVQALRDICLKLGIRPQESIAVGDGANDIPMLQEAGYSVGYRPKPAVRAIVNAAIDHGDLTAILYLQGYSREEFVT